MADVETSKFKYKVSYDFDREERALCSKQLFKHALHLFESNFKREF